MKRLYLLRHAKASQSSDFNDDHERPLAPRGVAATERLMRYLDSQATGPALVLCSSARRASETLEGIRPGLGADTDVTIDAGLYCAPTQQLLERVRHLPGDVDSAMVIGHNPGLHDLAVLLAGGEADVRLAAFPTGALVTLDASCADWDAVGEGACVIAGYVVPKELV